MNTIASSAALPGEPLPPPTLTLPEKLTPFFAVSRTKLLLMTVCSFNLYALFWFYMNWRRIRDREPRINPALRTVLAVVFCYGCFARIQRHGQRLGLPPALPASAAAVLWILFQMAGRFEVHLWWASLLTVVPMLAVQSQANAINERELPGHDRNASFSGWNWLLLVPGGLLLLVAMIGSTATRS